MDAYLEFEKPIATLEKKLQDLRDLSRTENMDLANEIKALESKVHSLIEETYKQLTPWQRVMVSRHPNRPHCLDYIESLFPDFLELQGDRAFREDGALVCGLAGWPPQPVKKDTCDLRPEASILIMGHQKGRTTKQKMQRNFGMVRPEGYRKAIRLMEMANRMRIPILTFVDTPGAYPSVDAEERGQSQAIAESIRTMFGLKVPVMTVVIGEGGSGGALAIGVGNHVMMLEHSTYSVISPEGCASILWSDASLAERASDKLKMGATEVKAAGVIDGIIPEPKGGAHRDWNQTFENVRLALLKHLDPWVKAHSQACRSKGASSKGAPDFAALRLEKFRAMGGQALGRTQPDGEPTSDQPKAKAKPKAEKSDKPAAKPKARKEASRRDR
ncbi:MAG TPA: acetyl-CoA carboxylase carboxyltransferase subunit alpha [Bdellovibrionota bacterium]|nr:acetyl-CoA carboxylase carboxyltransferase subunit alpha [Bdellovibrionota bacterium]